MADKLLSFDFYIEMAESPDNITYIHLERKKRKELNDYLYYLYYLYCINSNWEVWNLLLDVIDEDAQLAPLMLSKMDVTPLTKKSGHDRYHLDHNQVPYQLDDATSCDIWFCVFQGQYS